MSEQKTAFGVRDVLKIAIMIEQGGVQFYQRAADIVQDPEFKQMLLKLAKEEAQHAKSYSDVLEALSKNKAPSSTQEVSPPVKEFLSAWVHGDSFLLEKDPAALVKDNYTKDDIIRSAIELENKSISLYAAMRQLAQDVGTRDLINQILNEELKHVIELGHML